MDKPDCQICADKNEPKLRAKRDEQRAERELIAARRKTNIIICDNANRKDATRKITELTILEQPGSQTREHYLDTLDRIIGMNIFQYLDYRKKVIAARKETGSL